MIGSAKSTFGFDPRTIPGCQLWLDAADTSSMTLSGTTVTQWNDKSGNGRNTSSALGTSVRVSNAVNKLPGVYFNSTAFRGPFAYSGTQLHCFLVCTMGDSGNFTRILSIGNNVQEDYGSPLTTISFCRGGTGVSAIRVIRNNAGVNASFPAYNTPFLAVSAQYANTQEISVNGATPITSSTSTSAAFSTTTYGLGVQSGPTGEQVLVGYICELIVFDTFLTTSQRQQVEGYLAHKWGLTAYYLPRTPLTIPGCTIWLDGEDPAGTGTPPSAGTLATWVDKSGNGRNGIQYSSLARPTFVTNSLNSRGGVSFSAASSNCYQTATILPTPRALFVVGFSSNDGFILSGIPTPNSGHPPYYATFARDVEFGVNNTSDAAFLANVASTANVNYILTGLYTGSNVTAIMNGGTLSNTVAFSGTPKTPATTLIGINSYAGTLGAPLSGTINEFIAFNTDLTTTQRQTIEAYLARKWGLTSMYSSISSTHPFLSLKPHLRVFQPSDISNCILWMDAADNSTLTLQAGNKVSAWRDKSSNGFILSNATTLTQPTYVTSGWNASYPAVQVNGSGSGQFNFLSNAAFNGFNTTTWDIYTVVKHSATTNQAGIMWIDPSASFIIISAGIGNGQVYTTLSNGNWVLVPNTGAPTTQNPYIFQNYSTGTTLGRRLNGVQPGLTEQIVAFNWTAKTGTYPLCLANPSTGWSAPTSHFAEMLMFSRTLSDSERLRIEGYLSTKWGLTQTSFSSTAFTPTSIGGCQLWFDASDTASLTPSSITTGTKVSQWNDKSGNNRHMSNSTAATQPTYSTSNFNGSLPSVFFTGSTQASTNANILSNAASTVLNSTTWDIYVAFKPIGGMEAIFWNDPTSAVVLICGNTRVYEQNYSIHYGGWRLAPPDGGCRANECQIYQAYSTGTTLGKRVNGGLEGGTTQTATYSWPSRSSNSELAFCRPSTGIWSEGNLAIAEVIVYNSVLSDANRSNVQTYLTNKWRIGRGLQLGHPFYSIPPASVVFSPLSISGLALWLDGADQTSMTLSGSTVTQWRDKSGNGRNGTPTGSPTLSSGQIVFSGSQWFSGSISNTSANLTAFVVAKTTTSPATQYSRILSASAGGNDFDNTASMDVMVYVDTANTLCSFRNFVTLSTVTTTPNQTFLAVTKTNATTNIFYLNGTPSSTVTLSGGAVGSFGYTTYWVGSGPSGLNLTGTVSEALYYHADLTTTQRQQVEGYLAQKWGLTGSLPSTHPFKKIPA